MYRQSVHEQHVLVQLVNDLLDFVSSKDVMGRPVAADLKLGLATSLDWQTTSVSDYVTSHPGQLSLAIPSWVGTVSTGDGFCHR